MKMLRRIEIADWSREGVSSFTAHIAIPEGATHIKLGRNSAGRVEVLCFAAAVQGGDHSEEG